MAYEWVSLRPPWEPGVSTDEEFHRFVDARWAALVRFAWALTGDREAAEDVVQTALERTWRRWRSVQVEGAESYVRTAITRTVISQWRRRRLTLVCGLPGNEEDGVGGGDPPRAFGQAADEEAYAVRDAVWREIQCLPPRMRAVIVLRFLCDLSEAQTAAVLECSAGTVKSQTARAMSRLRERQVLRELTAADGREGDNHERA